MLDNDVEALQSSSLSLITSLLIYFYIQGGQAFFLKSDKPLPETAWARFGDSDPVGIGKTAIHRDKLFGTTPCKYPV